MDAVRRTLAGLVGRMVREDVRYVDIEAVIPVLGPVQDLAEDLVERDAGRTRRRVLSARTERLGRPAADQDNQGLRIVVVQRLDELKHAFGDILSLVLGEEVVRPERNADHARRTD